jgi:glycogen operon protein
MIALRTQHPELRQERFLTGAQSEDGRTEIAWFKSDGTVMEEGDWSDPKLRLLCVFLSYSANTPNTEKASGLFLVFNAGGDCEVSLPEVNDIGAWQRLLDTGAEDAFETLEAKAPLTIYRESVAVFVPKGG